MHLNRITLNIAAFPTREHYPFNLPIFQNTHQLEFNTPITFFIGENGTGKSTLLEGITKASGIHIWRNPEGLRYQRNPYEKAFFYFVRLYWTNGKVPGSYFSSETYRYFTEVVDEWAVSEASQLDYFGGKSLVTQSHGQSLMSYFRSRYKIRGLYLLDEPETALSPRSQLELLRILCEMSQAGHAQFIIATHSPILMSCPGATIYCFNNQVIQQLAYEQTEHYKVYHDFINNPGKYLQPAAGEEQPA